MKKLFSLFAAILFAGSMWAAEYTLVYTLDGSVTSGGNSNYAQDGGGLTQSGISWSVTGNTTINPWRIGGKNLNDVDRSAYSKTAIGDNIAKIEIEHGNVTLSAVNSMTVEVASNSNFSTIVSSFTPTFAANKTVTLYRPNDKDWSNCYYRITYNVDAGSNNSYLQLKSVKFYKEVSPTVSGVPTSTITFANAKQFGEVTEETFTLTGANLTANVNLSATGGFTVEPASITPTDGAFEQLITISHPTTEANTFNGVLTVSSAATEAEFTAQIVDLALTVTPRYTLTPVADGGEIAWEVNKVANPEYLEEGDVVTVTATADGSHNFDSWTFSDNITDAIAESNSAIFTMPAGNVTVTATFAEKEEPSVSGVPTELNFATKQHYAVTPQKFTLKGSKLTGNLTLASNNEAFVVEPTSILKTDAESEDGVEVTISPATPETATSPIAGKLTISGGGLAAVEVALSMAVTPTYLVQVAVNDANYGSATVAGEASIYATSADELALVATPKTGYEFVNWTVSADNIVIANVNAASTTANTTIDAVTVTANFRVQPTVNWYVNGKKVATQTSNTGSELTETPDLTGITIANKTFQGWATAAIEGTTDTKPTLLTPTTMPEDGANYYAVFATESGNPEVILLSEEFDNDLTSDSNSTIDGNAFSNFSGATSKAYKGAYGTIKFGNSSNTGYITSKALNLSQSFEVILKAKYYNAGADGASIAITIDDNDPVTIAASANLTSNFKVFSYKFDAATNASTVKIGTSGGNRAYIDSVVIKYPESVTRSAYATNANAVVNFEAPEHGTIVIKNSGTAIKSGDAFAEGTVLTITASADKDYKLTALTANDEDILEDKFFAVGTVDVTVTATFSFATGVDNIENGEKAVKVMKNGVLYIIRGDKTYTITGELVK